MSAGSQRPLAVTAIGWVWIISGVLAAISGIMSVCVYGMMRSFAPGEFPPEPPAEAPEGMRWFIGLFRYWIFAAIAQSCAGVLGAVAGAMLLKGRAWARAVLEALSWLGLCASVAFGVVWTYIWLGMISALSESGTPPPPGFGAFGVAAAVLSVAMMAVPLAIIVKHLRGATVRQFVGGPR